MGTNPKYDPEYVFFTSEEDRLLYMAFCKATDGMTDEELLAEREKYRADLSKRLDASHQELVRRNPEMFERLAAQARTYLNKKT